MKILLDMNVSPTWVEMLKKHGIEAVHWASVGDLRATDTQLMSWAIERGLVVITHDMDFGTALAVTGANGPSVVQIRAQDVLSEKLEELVVGALAQFSAELMSGAIVVVDTYHSRVRVLPIR